MNRYKSLLEKLNDNDYKVCDISDSEYELFVKDKSHTVQEKGKSMFEDYALIDLLPKGKKFIVIENSTGGYESGYEWWDFAIIIKHYSKYWSISDSGSN